MKLYIRPVNNKGNGWQKIAKILHPCSFIVKLYTFNIDNNSRHPYYEEAILLHYGIGAKQDFVPQASDFSKFWILKNETPKELLAIIIENDEAYLCVKNMLYTMFVEIDALFSYVSDSFLECSNYCFDTSLVRDGDQFREVLDINADGIQSFFPIPNDLRYQYNQRYNLGNGEILCNVNKRSLDYYVFDERQYTPSCQIINIPEGDIYHIARLEFVSTNPLFEFEIVDTSSVPSVGKNNEPHKYVAYFERRNTYKGYIIDAHVKAPVPNLYYKISDSYTLVNIYYIGNGGLFKYYTDGKIDVFNEKIEELPSGAVQISGGVCDLSSLTQRCIGAQSFDTTNGKPVWWNGTAWVDATGATV